MEFIVFNAMLLSMAGFVYFYVKSVRPAQMEKELGQKAYNKCARFRYISFAFTIIYMAAVLGYRYYPLCTNLPLYFNASWLYSAVMGLVLAVPASVLMMKAARAAGSESFTPTKSAEMYGGIYESIRHPQALGDIMYFLSLGFFLNSPFLVLFNLLWIPLYIYMSYEEETDLIIKYGKKYEEYMESTRFMIPRKSTVK